MIFCVTFRRAACKLAANEGLGWLKGFSPSSSPEKICENVCKLNNLMLKVRGEAKVLTSFDEVGMQETSAANQLVLGLVFAQCDDKTLTAVKDTLSSDKCKQMRAGLAMLDNLKFPEDCKIPQNVRVGISGYCSMFNMVGLETMFDMANKALGVQSEDISLGGVDENQTIPESSFRKMVDIVEENFYKSQELNAERVVDHTNYEP